MFDCLIIGKGPAGITASIYLKRYGFQVIVIGKDHGALEKTEEVNNYYGFTNIRGKDLVDIGINQASSLGVVVKEEEVISITKEKHFLVKTTKNTYEASSIFLATGKPQPSLKIQGFKEYLGKGISFCAICDGFFYRNKKLAIIGNKEFMHHELNDLLNFSKDITIFTNGMPLEADAMGLNVVTEKIVTFSGTEKLEKIVTSDNEYLIDGAFIALKSAGANDFAVRMGAIIENNYITVDKNYMTNIEGLFAGGDCIGGLAQIGKAVFDGTSASLAIKNYINEKSK